MSLQLNGTDGVTFNDGSEQWAAASPIGTKNLIINGNMQIAQRGTSATGLTGAGYHTVDRFLNNIAAAGTWTSTQDTDVPSGQGFANSHKLTCTATASAVVLATMYMMEGQMLQHLKKGTANAESLTLSFWVKSNKTGTYINELYDNDNTRQISKSYTINSADTWEKKTLTFAGDTIGTLDNDNTRSIDLYFWFGANSTYAGGTLNTSWASAVNANRAAGVVNLADTIGNYINITGVQLEIGDTATPFEVMPYDMQLARCQRYYEAISKTAIQDNICNAHCWNTTTAYGVLQYSRKRAAPSITLTATDYIVRFGGTTNNVTSTNISQFTVDRCQFGLVTSGLTVGYGAWLAFDSDAVTDQKIEINAEL